jgi:hypothetical protein
MDAFESTAPDPPTVVLERCRGRHSDSGIHSVQSRVQWMKRPQDTHEQANDESNGAPQFPKAAQIPISLITGQSAHTNR